MFSAMGDLIFDLWYELLTCLKIIGLTAALFCSVSYFRITEKRDDGGTN